MNLEIKIEIEIEIKNSILYYMNETTVFAILTLITALAYVGNPFSDNNYSDKKQNGGVNMYKKSRRRRRNKGNHKSRKH